MKKLELKNLKVKKMTSEEQLNVKGGIITRSCGNSSCNSCNETSIQPIACSSMRWACN